MNSRIFETSIKKVRKVRKIKCKKVRKRKLNFSMDLEEDPTIEYLEEFLEASDNEDAPNDENIQVNFY